MIKAVKSLPRLLQGRLLTPHCLQSYLIIKMKRLIWLLPVLVVALVTWLCLNKQSPQKPPVPELPNAVVMPRLYQPETNEAGIISNTVSMQAAQRSTNIIESTVPLTNALTATNIEQWKLAVTGLKRLTGFTMSQHWLAEQPGRTNGLPITLRVNVKAVEYSAVLISVNAQNENGQIMRVEMQTPNMNIDETRELGLQLCSMFGRDPGDYLTWCDKVGNHWLDSPLYSSRNIYVTNSNETFGFQTLHSYNNDNPWIINLVITSL